MLFDQAIDIPADLTTDGLEIKLRPESSRYSLRLKKSNRTAAQKISGLKFPSKIGGAHFSAGYTVLCLGPDEWLLIADPKSGGKLSKALAKIEKGFTISLTDISHRNIGLDITGPRAVKIINAGCPLDLSLETFPVGKTTRTVFEGASIILTRTAADRFEIECWRSFAPYLRDYFLRIVQTNV